MKKALIFLLCAAMLLCMVGCGQEKPAPSDPAGGTTPTEKEPEYFDAGNVKAVVPEGWTAFAIVDIFSEDGATKPNSLVLIKGGESEADQFTKPYVEVHFFGEDLERMDVPTEFYDDVVILPTFTTGSHTWNGFTSSDLGKIAIIWAEEEPLEYQANIVLQSSSGQSIALTDPDVLQILESIAPSDKK